MASLTLLGLHLMLARLLPPADFGAFALTVSAAMVGIAAITALVLDPLSVRARSSGAYVGFAVLLLGVLAVGVVPIVAVLPALEGTVAALAAGVVATPGLGLLWLARRVAYLRRRPGSALVASLLWSALTGGGLAAAWGVGGLSSGHAATVISAAAAIAGGLSLRRVVQWPRLRLWRAGLVHHLGFGGWLLAGLPFWAAAMHAPLWLVAALHGPEAAGGFRILHLLGMPLVQLAAAVGTVHQPRLATLRAQVGEAATRAEAWRLGWRVTAPAVPWALLLIVWPGLVPAVFGAPYAVFAVLAPVMVLAAAIKTLTTAPNLALRAARRGRPVFAGTAAAGVCALGGSLLLIPPYGVGGAVAAFAAGAAANLVLLSVAVRPREVIA